MLASFLSGSFSYTSRADFTFIWGVSLTHPVLASFFFFFFFFFFGLLLLLLLLLLFFLNLWSFSYTSRDDFCFYQGSFPFTSPAGLFYIGSFSYTSHAAFIFLWGVFLIHLVLASFFFESGEFLLHIPCWL